MPILKHKKQVWTVGVNDEQALMLVCLARIWSPGGSGYVLDVDDKRHFNKIGTYQGFNCCGFRRIKGAE